MKGNVNMKYPINVLADNRYLPYMVTHHVLDEDEGCIRVCDNVSDEDLSQIADRFTSVMNKLDVIDYNIIWLRYRESYSRSQVMRLLSITADRFAEAVANMHKLLSGQETLRYIVYGDKKSRIDKQEYYLNIAHAASLRSTCLRRKYGAIIVKNDEIISTGYNGAPRGRCNCTDLGMCLRSKNNIPAGQRYELCRSVHAEANAIISASRHQMIDATLYLYGSDADTGEALPVSEPCSMCKRLIINAGIAKVVSKNSDNKIIETEVDSWIKNDESLNLESLLH